MTLRQIRVSCEVHIASGYKVFVSASPKYGGVEATASYGASQVLARLDEAGQLHFTALAKDVDYPLLTEALTRVRNATLGLVSAA